jgi:tRNA threonylcarbamoyladenosine biosynthesis protein TsaE
MPNFRVPFKVRDFTVITESDQETIRAGQALAPLLKGGDVVGLVGDLGSGKTWFTKGIALGLGVNPGTVVTSPTFVIVNVYEARLTLFHVDIYRLQSLGEFYSAGLDEYLYGKGIAAMEWADRWPEVLPAETLKVEFVILDDHRRQITFVGHHPRSIEIVEFFAGKMDRG